MATMTINAEERLTAGVNALERAAKRADGEVTARDMILLQMVHAELGRSRRERPAEYSNIRDAAWRLQDQMDELFDAMTTRRPCPEVVLNGLLQLAAEAIRIASDVVVPQLDGEDFIRMQIEAGAASGAPAEED